MSAGRRRLLIAAAVLLGIAALLFLGDRVTSSPAVCGSCHEIAPSVASWRESPHAQVLCVDCHVAPYAWYEFPKALGARTALLVRDAVKHRSGDYDDPVEIRPAGSEPMLDAVCMECHVPGRQITPGPRILIDHEEHAARNGYCVSCHLRTAHPLPERGDRLSFMSQCFTCHGHADSPEAPTECGVCHPAEMDLVPTAHRQPEWMPGHGAIALSDRRFCEMCHDEQYCTDCHGVLMPHPTGWADAADGHGASAERDRAICARCHEGGDDMCTVCHHTDFDRSRGTWLEQHPGRAQELGSKRCLECHDPPDCTRCHARNAQ